ncbi:MAG: hypothetical protein HC857_05125 [Synechococcales cyanobacterium RU_4_20]|nr:hypothetical protein [Synechococcales cyanobacterium RU_4_20]NJR67393.1 hypothetical protein [Synechococcales cyanobacterium CRU_2_2]
MTSPVRSLLGLLLLLSTSSCALVSAQVSNPQPQNLEESPSPAQGVAQTQNAPIGRPDRQLSSVDMTSISVFELDNQCDKFVGKVVKLPRETALNQAVGQAIQASSTLDLDLAGYRVIDGPGFGEVTVDFRIAPQAKRSLQSLSICEGLSLYGSIRRTLINNGQFGLTQVRFTLAGQELR